MYTLFCQKKFGTNPVFPLTQQLVDFLEHPQARGLFVFPGFISRTEDSISDFLSALLTKNGTKLVDYFGVGNQNTYTPDAAKKELKPEVALSKHQSVVTSKGIQWIDISRNGDSDHRKMVFIFDILCNEADLIKKIDKTNYSDFLKQIKIIGVAIGSSNFSYTTYSVPWHHTKYTASSGEADIFMFRDDKNGQFIQEYVNKLKLELERNQKKQHQKVLSKAETPIPSEFFNTMFRESLELILA